MKKLIEKIKSVGWDKWSKILIGFLALAILWTLFFALQTEASDVVAGDLTQYYQFIPFDDWNLGASDVSSDYQTMRVFYNSTSSYKQGNIWIVARDTDITAFGATLYNVGAYEGYVSIVSDTSFPSYYYNIYKVSFYKDSNYIDISVPWDYTPNEPLVDIYGLYVFSYSDYSSDVEEYINSVVSDLNSFPDYITNIQTITGNGNQINVLTTVNNNGVFYEEQIFTGPDMNINVVGQLATTTGIDYYTASVGVDSLGTLVNSASDQKLTTGFVNYVTASGLNIRDYDKNAVFDLTIDLSDYFNRTVPVTINAHSNDGSVRFLVGIINVSVYSPSVEPDDPETDTGTDTPGEIETEPVPGGDYDEGYLAGYEQALRDNNVGIFADATLDAYFSFSHISGTEFPLSVHFQVNPNSGGLDFSQVWNWFLESKYNNSDYTVKSIELNLRFPAGFIWTEGVLYVSFDPNVIASATWLPFNTEAFAVEYEDGASLSISYGAMVGKNRWYLTTPSGYEEDRLSIDMLRFDINQQNLSFQDFFLTYDFTLYTNISKFTTDTFSYNKGLDDGYKRGEDSGYKSGYKEGYDVSKELIKSESYNEGYNAAKDKYYNDGFKAGTYAGKNEAMKEDFKFYDLFFSIFDAPISVLRTTFNFEIMGVNISAFILGIFTLLLGHKALKMVT